MTDASPQTGASDRKRKLGVPQDWRLLKAKYNSVYRFVIEGGVPAEYVGGKYQIDEEYLPVIAAGLGRPMPPAAEAATTAN